MNSDLILDSALADMLVLDRMNDFSVQDVLYSFALDELLCRQTGRGGPSICHIWRYPKGFVLGLKDSRLPGAGAAMKHLESEGWSAAVRNSGGAAVPLDEGVVNISLIMPKRDVHSFHFHDDFENMYALIRAALARTGQQVNKGEIAGAYCPGEYDLSIGGLKFCGIAQRRQTQAYIVQAFVVAEGSGQERARLVRDFYNRSAAGEKRELDFPQVTEGSMASLEELTTMGKNAGSAFAAEIKRIVTTRQTPQGIEAATGKLVMPTREQIMNMAEQLRARYA